MMRSIFILCLMLQLSRTTHGNEIQAHEEMPAFEDEEDNSSIEELTTTSYDSRTETYPPIIVSTASSPEEASTSFLMKLVGFDSTEPTVNIPTEVATATLDPVHEDRMDVFLKKPRLLDANTEEILPRSGHADEDSYRHLIPEETTIFTPIEDDMNDTIIEEVDDDTTVLPLLAKPTKGPKIYKMRPNELLRHYVEDSHLRSPIAALIDKKRNPLSKAKKLWKAALKPNSLLDIMVVSYDSEGIKSTYNLTNTRAMISTLDRVREENATAQESKTFYSIIRTGQLIPYDSAIFLSTDHLPNDTEHQQQASMILLKKRIRLYLIIFDDKNHVPIGNSSTAVRKTGFLGQLALRTGGDVIYVPTHAFRPDGEMGLITLVVGNRLKPIDSELKEIYENELKNDNTEIISENEETTSIH